VSNWQEEIAMAWSSRPEFVHGGIALGCVVAVVLVLQFSLGLPWTWYHLLIGWLLGVNLTAFAYYGYDKRQATANGPRVPELVLHGLAVVGGTLGAYGGMQLFRHKTIKGAFQIFFWAVAVLQVVLVAVVVWKLVSR
jgi:uncharacterized membrane protein YsdA (DUF1294 family)